LDDHTFLWRYDSSTNTASAVLSAIDGVLTAIGPQLYTITIGAVRFSLAGSVVSLPIAWTGSATYGTGTASANDRGAAIQFIARSATGRRTSFWLYAVDATAPIGYRLTAAGNVNVANAITALDGVSSALLYVAIDNTDPVHYPYANWKINDYWLHQTR